MWNKLHEIFGLDLRSLALFRVLVGLLLLAELAARVPDLTAFYTDAGVVPLSIIPPGQPVSIHLLNGSFTYQVLLFLFQAAFAVLLLLGWHTRLAVLLSWFLLISLQARNPAIMHNGDVFLRNCLFFAIFLPLGAVWSVDCRFRSRPLEVGPLFLNGGSIGYILQICIIYWFAVIWKSAPEWRSEFSAVHYALHVEPLASPLAQYIRQFPILCAGLTIMTLIVEAFGPLLVLFPYATQWTRLIAVVTFIGLHAGFGAFIVLGNFAPVCWVCWLALMPPLFWDLLRRWGATPARKSFILRTALPSDQLSRIEAFRSLLLIPDVTIAADQKEEITPDVIRHLLWLSPLFWVVAWLPRSILGQLAVWLRQPSPRPLESHEAEGYRQRYLLPYQGVVSNTLVLFCLAYVFAWNVRTVAYDQVRSVFPLQVNSFGSALALEQSHGVFAPAPGKRHGWYVLVARLRDGQEIDPRTGQFPSYDPPANLYRWYINSRWRRYLQNMPSEDFILLRPYYAEWIRREWDREHPENPTQTLEIWFMARMTTLQGFTPPQRELLYRLSTRTQDREAKP